VIEIVVARLRNACSYLPESVCATCNAMVGIDSFAGEERLHAHAAKLFYHLSALI